MLGKHIKLPFYLSLKLKIMNTPNPWDEGYTILKDEYTKEQIDKLTLGKLIPILSKETKKPTDFYWDMIYDIVSKPREYKSDN